jgi:ApbE superfamily uncharacterized protein (UPF0280 family)
MSAQRTQLDDDRWHFQHGPIDVVIGVKGRADAVQAGHARAWARFTSILDELVGELGMLRLPVANHCALNGKIARRMWHACQPHSKSFITPMAAVAGSVAEELIACYALHGIKSAWVNNGGDIALHLMPGEALRIGLYADLARLDAREIQNGLENGLNIDGQFEITSAIPVRGVATSGWRGRSFSLGIADSVTVLARTASAADAAATIIANAVNVDDPRISRSPACDIKDDSDLGALAVTVDVPRLAVEQVAQALQAGRIKADELRAAGLIWSAVLLCQGQVVTSQGENAEMLQFTEAGQQTGSVFA